MTKVTNIYIARHGETEWNLEQRIQGNKNSPLTAKGIRQAQDLKKALESYSFNFAYVSPLQRARDTIDIILKGTETTPIVADNFREIALGPWEGKIRSETKATHPEQYTAFWDQPDAFKLQGAETYQQLQDRMVQEIESLFTKHIDCTILVVSHWIAIKAALAYYSAIPLSNIPDIPDPKNGGFYCLSMSGNTVSVQ